MGLHALHQALCGPISSQLGEGACDRSVDAHAGPPHGGVMVARPLMPAISSGASPMISPITLID